MDVWSETSSEMGQGTVFLKSVLDRGWLGRMLSRRRNCRGEDPSAVCVAEHGEWSHRIQSLSEECDALRRKMQFSA